MRTVAVVRARTSVKNGAQVDVLGWCLVKACGTGFERIDFTSPCGLFPLDFKAEAVDMERSTPWMSFQVPDSKVTADPRPSLESG